MNNMDSIIDISRLKTEEMWHELGEEVIYSIHLRDFLRMPDMDFKEIGKTDPYIRVLFN